ncbi:hypothetical protein M0R04_11205 [Candidatus Dojkabacteria bacterium]|jgi:hypothetical protein|nr:hypothetical protein [Candidatus Dojkabacteria bacterium]
MVSKTNTRRDVFRGVYTVLNASKPSGWYVRSVFPNVDTEFPLIFLHPVDKNSDFWSNDGTNSSDDILIQIEVMVHIDSAPEVLDTGRDYVTDEIQDNVSTFYSSYNIDLLGIDDGGTNMQEYNNETYLTGTFTVRFRRL